jgi:D-3-phosphoglycerate dehydrogenase
MSSTIIVTGAALAAPAQQLAARRQARLLTIKPYTPPADIAALAATEHAEAIIVRAAHITDDVLAAATSLKVIVKHGIGVDTIDVASATRRGIPVLITHGANAQSVAEHALGLMFAVTRSIARLDHRIRNGYWDKSESFGTELSGKALGIVGLGSIGRALIELVRPLRMTIRGFDPFIRDAIAGVEIVDDLDALLRASDIVSLHSPLTEQNRNLIDARRLDLMRPGAVLINTARGGLIDQFALAGALAAGRIAGAGLDCFPVEPPQADNPLRALPNVVMTPHIGANTREAAERVGVRAVEQALDVIEGKPFDPRANVNPAYATAPV